MTIDKTVQLKSDLKVDQVFLPDEEQSPQIKQQLIQRWYAGNEPTADQLKSLDEYVKGRYT